LKSDSDGPERGGNRVKEARERRRKENEGIGRGIRERRERNIALS